MQSTIAKQIREEWKKRNPIGIEGNERCKRETKKNCSRRGE
jgi:hypothetical protein